MGVRASRLGRLCALGAIGGALSACTVELPPPARAPGATGTDLGLQARYTVVLDETGTLTVELRADDPAFRQLVIESGAEAFIRDLEAGPDASSLTPIDATQWPLEVPACRTACIVRYRFDLQNVAESFGNPQWADRHGDAVLAPPTTWLVRPQVPGQGSFELSVDVPTAQRFACALNRGADGLYRARLDDLPQAPYAAFGSFEAREIRLGRKSIEVVRIGDAPSLGDDAIETWVTLAAQDVATYFGGFPPERAIVFVLVEDGHGISEGTALGNGGAGIIVHVGRDIPGAALLSDWILTHEMVHLSMPGLAAEHRWLEEGLATYLEPVARAQLGRMLPEEVWGDWYVGMRKGQPLAGEGGLDGTERWGRVYWGGAAFWLMAEVAIADETEGQKSLRDCLRAVASQGGTIESRWSVRRFLSVCDSGLGEPIVEPLYEEVADEAVEIDLDALFERLGVKKGAAGVELDDAAPRASVRRAILSPTTVDVPRPKKL